VGEGRGRTNQKQWSCGKWGGNGHERPRVADVKKRKTSKRGVETRDPEREGGGGTPPKSARERGFGRSRREKRRKKGGGGGGGSCP